MTKVAVVTGSNKGVGYGIVQALCKQFDGDVYLTSRNPQLGDEAIKKLNKEGLKPKYHQLDITDKSSISSLKQHLETQYGGVDVLVNNAGIAYKAASTASFAEQAEVTMKTNYTGTLDVCEALFPILKPGSRVVHVSSGSSTGVMKRGSADRLKKIQSLSTIDDVTNMMAEFVSAAKAGKHKNLGWTDSAYGTSKVGVTAIAPIQQAAFDKDISRPGIVVNACCPGYVDTDMTSHKGPKTIEQGADTPVYLALLPAGVAEPKGDFLQDRIIYKWKEGKFP